MSIDAVLMASGQSKRFGRGNKLIYPFRGKALARHTLDLVFSLKIWRNVFFVAADERVVSLAQDIKEPALRIIENKRNYLGQAESIKLGAAAAEGAGYIMFFPCDQPLLDGATVLSIAGAAARKKICRPVFAGKGNSPALFSAFFRGELLALKEGETGKDVIARHKECVIDIEIENGTVLKDFDTLEDFFIV